MCYEFIGQDKLGTFIYEGDYVYDDAMGDSGLIFTYYDRPDNHRRVLCISEEASGDAIDVEIESAIVILPKSPRRSNYERYFADSVPLVEMHDFITENFCSKVGNVYRCIDDINLDLKNIPDEDRTRCPFVGWHKWVDFQDYKPCLANFITWLKIDADITR